MQPFTHMKTVAGIFSSFAEAESAAHGLEAIGIPPARISVIAGNDANRHDEYLKRVRHESVPTARAAVAGASFGGAAGFVATLITLAIPGVGVAVAGGALATVLGGLAVGATAGGLIGALADMGISREEAPLYEEAVRRGIIILVAELDDPMEPEAFRILRENGSRDVKEEIAPFDPHPYPRDSSIHTE